MTNKELKELGYPKNMIKELEYTDYDDWGIEVSDEDMCNAFLLFEDEIKKEIKKFDDLKSIYKSIYVDMFFLRYKNMMSYAAIGYSYDKSTMRVSQIINRTLRRMRRPSKRLIFKKYLYQYKGMELIIESPKEKIIDINSPIDDLDLSIRARNCLAWRRGYRYIKDLKDTSLENLLSIKGIGKVTAEEIIKQIKPYIDIAEKNDNDNTVAAILGLSSDSSVFNRLNKIIGGNIDNLKYLYTGDLLYIPNLGEKTLDKIVSGAKTYGINIIDSYHSAFNNDLCRIVRSLSLEDYCKNSTKEKIASDKKTPERFLRLLSTDKFWSVRYTVISNPNTPMDVLEKLSSDENESVRQFANSTIEKRSKVIAKPVNNNNSSCNKDIIVSNKYDDRDMAKDKNCSPEILDKLSYNDWEEVRCKVAINPNTKTDTLYRLSEDNAKCVRIEVAKNPNTPADVLCKLSKDTESIVRCKVAINPNTTPDVLYKLVKDDIKSVRLNVAKNNNAPVGVLEMLLNDNYDIRLEIARNPNVSIKILKALSADKHSVVRMAANKELQTRLKERMNH